MKFLTTLVLIIASVSAFAEIKTSESTSELESLKKRVKELENARASRLNTSREWRNGKRFSLDIGMGTMLDGTGIRATAGYYIDRDTILNISAFSGDDDNYDNEEVDALYIGAKIFTSNSFYLRPEFYLRNYDEDRYFSEFSDNVDVSGEQRVTLQDYGVSFAIGNQWQWKNLTIGADWIGVTYQIDTIKDEYRELSGDDWRWDEVSVQLLSFYVGASF